jgi:hypothetical protein
MQQLRMVERDTVRVPCAAHRLTRALLAQAHQPFWLLNGSALEFVLLMLFYTLQPVAHSAGQTVCNA